MPTKTYGADTGHFHHHASQYCFNFGQLYRECPLAFRRKLEYYF